MRLWSIHPRYLDWPGLVAAWREALLAKAVLEGRTRGYRQHPQLERFRAHPRPLEAIDVFLAGLHAEATARGFRFNAGRFRVLPKFRPIPVNRGQLDFEFAWLKNKLWRRDRLQHALLRGVRQADPHPLFRVIPGGLEPWERGRPPIRDRKPKARGEKPRSAGSEATRRSRTGGTRPGSRKRRPEKKQNAKLRGRR